MEEIYLTVAELAELKGCTERHIRAKILKQEILAETIKMKQQGPGRGGIQYRIPLSSLERKLQTKFKRRLRAVENALHPEPVFEETDAETLTHEEREQIIFWKRTLGEWHSYRDSAASKEKADEAFLDMFKIRYPEMKLTRRTLYRKWQDWQKKAKPRWLTAAASMTVTKRS